MSMHMIERCHLRRFFFVVRVLFRYLIEKFKIYFWHALLYYRPENTSFRTCASKNAGDDKPL